MHPDTNSAGSVERRQHERARIHLEAVLEGRRPEDAVRLTVLNFSAGGFFCRVNRAIRPMTRLGIRFIFPPYGEHAPREMETTALVVRCDRSQPGKEEYFLAACFLELPTAAREHIQGYVDWFELVYGGEEAAARAKKNAD